MDLLKAIPKAILKRLAIAGLGLSCLCGPWGCGSRDLSAPMYPTGSNGPSGSDSVAIAKPGPQVTAKDSARDPVEPILIETLSATDLRMELGETKPAPVTVLPARATSPLYELTSSNPAVAKVTPDGIRGAGAGSATITVHALDGSGKTTRFHVIVDAIAKACVSFPCLCIAAAMKTSDNGEGKDKGQGGQKAEESGDCAD